MILQEFNIDKYNWRVQVYYYVDKYYTEEILENLRRIGCNQDCLLDARNNMSRGQLNSGLCYSNSKRHETIIVIAKTTSPELFVNSWLHEAKHLLSHMEQEFNINPYSEEAAYLCGYIGQYMYSTAKNFLCKCHFSKLKVNH